MTAGRAAGVLLALGVAAVLAAQLCAQVLIEDAHESVRTAPPGPLATATRDQALSDLERARSLRPGTEADVVGAQVELRAGRHQDTARLARRVVADEPESFEGWLLLGAALSQVEPESAESALARARELNPLYRIRRAKGE